MAIKRYKPTSAARRFMSVSTFEEITCTKPERSLLEDQRHTAGRNAQGKITVRHHGGGNKRKYRIIDFKRNKDDIPATVKSIQYDPNRSAHIALIVYADGEKRYIIHPVGLNVGDTVLSMSLLAKVTQSLPLGVAYPVWTGIGAVGTVLVGIFIFHEPATFWRLFFTTTLIVSIVGLKILS